MGKVRLTKAQLELVSDLLNNPKGVHVANYWPPAKRLVDLGFAEWRTVGFSTSLCLTPAGRQALAEAERDDALALAQKDTQP